MPPTVFLSYCRDTATEKNEAWVLDLARRLVADGMQVRLDQWDSAPGDLIAFYMQEVIATSDYILMICTPRYKISMEKMRGAAGYETNIIATQLLLTADHRRYLTIIKEGTETTSVPFSLQGKRHLFFDTEANYTAQYPKLLQAMTGVWSATAPAEKHNKDVPDGTIEDRSDAALSFSLLRYSGTDTIRAKIGFYRKAILDNHHNDAAYFGLAICLLHHQLFDAAILQLQKAVELLPDQPEYHYYLALALCRGGPLSSVPMEVWSEILQHLEIAIWLDKRQAKYLYFLLLLYHTNTARYPLTTSLPVADIEQLIPSAYYDKAEIQRLAAWLGLRDAVSIRVLFNH
jgi:tetratricopeptide (TPR) repeat protein